MEMFLQSVSSRKRFLHSTRTDSGKNEAFSGRNHSMKCKAPRFKHENHVAASQCAIQPQYFLEFVRWKRIRRERRGIHGCSVPDSMTSSPAKDYRSAIVRRLQFHQAANVRWIRRTWRLPAPSKSTKLGKRPLSGGSMGIGNQHKHSPTDAK